MTSENQLAQTAHQLAQLHLKHYKERSRLQRFVEAMTVRMSHPWFVWILLTALIAWIGAHVYNFIDGAARVNADQSWISILLEFAAVLITALILTGQHKEEDLSDERQELTLHLLMLIDRKISDSRSAAPIDVAAAKECLDAAHEREFAKQRVI